MTAYKAILVGGKWDDIFLLPGNALKLWLYHYRCEGGELRESWPTEEQICAACGMNRKTMYHWRRWLVDNGWLDQLAFARSALVAGAWIAPSFKARHGIIPDKADKRKNNRVPKFGIPSQKLVSQVLSSSCSGSGSNSFSGGFSFSSSKDVGENQRQNALKNFENHNQNQRQEQPQPQSSNEPTTQMQSLPNKSTSGRNGKPKCAGDGTPYPDNFDDMPNLSRLTWLALHNPKFHKLPEREQRTYTLKHLCPCGEFPIAEFDGKPQCAECLPSCVKHPGVPAIWRSDGCDPICRECADAVSRPRRARIQKIEKSVAASSIE